MIRDGRKGRAQDDMGVLDFGGGALGGNEEVGKKSWFGKWRQMPTSVGDMTPWS